MVFEYAEIDVTPGSEADFETGVAAAVALFRGAKGCQGLELQRSIENPNRYRLVVRWETLESHTVDFRQSAAFQQWRALVGPYFASPPRVEHTTVVRYGF